MGPKLSPGQALGKATLAALAAPAAGSKRRPLAAAFASQAHAPRRQSRHQEPAQAAAGEAPSSATAELCPLPEPAMASLPLLRCLWCSCWPACWQRCRVQQGRSGGVGFQRLLCQGCKWLQAGGAQPLQATAQAGAAPASAGAAAAGCKWWQAAFIFPASLEGFLGMTWHQLVESVIPVALTQVDSKRIASRSNTCFYL